MFKSLTTCCQVAFQKHVPITTPPGALEKSFCFCNCSSTLAWGRGSLPSVASQAVLTMNPLSCPQLLFLHCPPSWLQA